MSVKSRWIAAISVLALGWPVAAQITGSRVNPGTQPGQRTAAERPKAEKAVRPVEAEAGVEAEAEADAAEAIDSEVDANAQAQAGGPIVAATRSDVRAGVEVRDTEGGLVGTVESVDSEGAVVSTGNVRAKLPFESFGKNENGLVISLSRTELEAAAAAQSPS